MAKLLNLDKYISEDRVFRVKGMDFKVPGLIPVKTVLKISKIGQEATSDPERAVDALREVWAVLATVNPDKKEEDFQTRISTPMLVDLIQFIFNDAGGEDVDGGVVDLSKNGSGGAEQKGS